MHFYQTITAAMSLKLEIRLHLLSGHEHTIWYRSIFYAHLIGSYTERQNKHHFFRATLTKIHVIKINIIWTQINFNTP